MSLETMHREIKFSNFHSIFMNTSETPVFFQIGNMKFNATTEKLFQLAKMLTQQLTPDELSAIESDEYNGRDAQPLEFKTTYHFGAGNGLLRMSS